MERLIICTVLIAVSRCATVRQEAAANCAELCTDDYDPVCGTDGQTYANQCYLHQAQCTEPEIVLAHLGPCRTVHPRGIICTTPMCNHHPSSTPEPRVCGSDGITYDSHCDLNNAKCGNEDLMFVHNGPCHPEVG